jgi:hypothetical protein
MGLFDQGDPPPLYVPDLTKPAGATVDADGNVTCISCQTRLPLSRADVVGQGYRCPACTGKAELNALTGGPSDVGANLSIEDRRGLRGAGAAMIVPGVLMILGGLITMPYLRRLPVYLIIAGIAGIGAGVGRMRAAG